MLFRSGFRMVEARDPQWNRGAYLIQGLGHCGACHEARNSLGAIRSQDNPAGGVVLNWYAPALDSGVGSFEPASGSGDFGDDTAQNPADLAPAVANPSGSHGVPNYVEVSGNLPELRLDLHVYAARPEERFAMINMKKVHEGDLLPEGVRVESITPEGAVLSYNGSRFLLPRD